MPGEAVAAPASRKLGHYRILEKIGSGGMGEVYRARDERLDREVAIKVLSAGVLADETARKRFRQEALALSKFNHPNIATIYDFDAAEGADFIVTELVKGETLAERIAARRLPEKEILDLALQLAEGLAAAHERGIVHRDLKPANLRLTADGRLKILDFGVAAPLPTLPDSTTAESDAPPPGFAGTLPYMSPEQLRGETVDVRSDLYSAGTVLCEMITGRHPFESRLFTTMLDGILNKPPTPPSRLRPEISPRLEEIVLRCLEKQAARRYQSARELALDLRRAADSGGQARKSIAVLYLENLGGNKEDEYFRDGITEDITTELAKIAELRVFSRSAVLAFRDKPVMPTEVGRQLDASHVLEGSLRREGTRLRITAKLVDTRTGHAVWAERYDRQLEDVFAIQDEIAHSIARELRLALSEQEQRAIRKIPTADMQAYDFYLRGRQFFHQFRRKGFDFAREMFAKAIELDPGYARAYAGIADCSAFLYFYWDSSETNIQQADEASRKALELDFELAEAHASRGLAASLRKNYDEAKREFETAMRLGPNLFEPYYFYARNCYAQGELQQAVEWFEHASHVNPEDYQAPMLMASALHGLGRAKEAGAAYRRGLSAAQKHLLLHPGDTRALYFGANALSQVGDRERSLEWAARAVELEGEEPQVLYNVACVYALLGEAERAIDCLERSLTHGWGQRQWIEHDPDLASLREHPRFRALIGHR
ncbi:MAG: protein kinase [Acidobacteriia bacterium]|nr:protein kinase [Terriglobia bacterium]